jgi:hypothetical protein
MSSAPIPSSGSSAPFEPFKKDGRIVRIIDADNSRHHNKFGLISSFLQGQYAVKVQLDGLSFQLDDFKELFDVTYLKENTESACFAPESLQYAHTVWTTTVAI